MNPELLKTAVNAVPFWPFWLILANGDRLFVPRREKVWLLPRDGLIGLRDQDGDFRLLDIGLLAGIETEDSPS